MFRQAWLGWVARIALVVTIVVALHFAIDWMIATAEASARKNMLMTGMLVGLIVAYALLIALPFVPGIEIGISLLALRGAEIAPFIYLATVAGLMLAYIAGCRLPYTRLAAWLQRMHLTRASELVLSVTHLSPPERLKMLRARLPGRIAHLAVGGRYVLLALLINLPGSGVIGGGGGICLVAGLSRLFRLGPTLLTLSLAVAPAPLLFWWLGWTPPLP